MGITLAQVYELLELRLYEFVAVDYEPISEVDFYLPKELLIKLDGNTIVKSVSPYRGDGIDEDVTTFILTLQKEGA